MVCDLLTHRLAPESITAAGSRFHLSPLILFALRFRAFYCSFYYLFAFVCFVFLNGLVNTPTVMCTCQGRSVILMRIFDQVTFAG